MIVIHILSVVLFPSHHHRPSHDRLFAFVVYIFIFLILLIYVFSASSLLTALFSMRIGHPLRRYNMYCYWCGFALSQI